MSTTARVQHKGQVTIPTADDEYTPAQRRIIDARLDKADAAIKAGRVHGPFSTADEAIKFLHKEIRSRQSRNVAALG